FWNRDAEHKATIGREFNGAIMMAMKIQSERGHYDFELMDEEMKFAKEHNMKLFGAGLIYKNVSSPEWLHFTPHDCGGWSEKDLDQIIKDDITTIVHHGGDMYYAWEVVDEPVTQGHNGCWSHVFGGFQHGGQEKMIAKASQYTHEANPNIPVL